MSPGHASANACDVGRRRRAGDLVHGEFQPAKKLHRGLGCESADKDTIWLGIPVHGEEAYPDTVSMDLNDRLGVAFKAHVSPTLLKVNDRKVILTIGIPSYQDAGPPRNYKTQQFGNPVIRQAAAKTLHSPKRRVTGSFLPSNVASAQLPCVRRGLNSTPPVHQVNPALTAVRSVR